MKRWATEELLGEARLGKRPAVEAHTAQSSFHGRGLQNSGNGHITVGGDVNIGMVLPGLISSIDGLPGNWRESRLDCQRDLFITDPKEDRAALKRKKGGHAPGTCGWILSTKELTVWLSSAPKANPEGQPTQVLWLHGNPGTGKSIMAIYLTEELPTASSDIDGATVAYFFCDSGFDTRKTATSIVRGLLYQLAERHEQLLDYILPKYRARGAELFTSFDALWEIFMAMVADQNTGRKYCIIDALDECDKESQEILLQQLEETFRSQNLSPNVRILVTSRPYPEISASLRSFPNKDLASFPERQQDINLCIERKVEKLAKRRNYTNKVKGQVHEILRDKAGGTFLWIGLACDELKDTPSHRVIRALQAIPKGLHSLYKKLLETALEQSETSGDDIRRVLSCVAVSSRPLTVSELSEACQLHQEEKDVETRLQFAQDCIESCRLMIIIQNEKVLLLHKSIKDYLVGASSSCFIQELEAHARLAYRCVDLLIEQFNGVSQPHTTFSDYAILEWPNHARMAKSGFKVQCSQAEFFAIDSSYREQWLKLVRPRRGIHSEPIAEKLSIFHVAAEWGVSALVDHASGLEVQGSDTEMSSHVPGVNCVDGSGRTPLEQAAGSRYPNVIAALLRWGGKVTIQAVKVAAGNWGYGKEMMTLLLDHDYHGDQITITNEVVKAAAGNGGNGTEVMTILLDRRGDQIAITDEVVKAAAGNRGNGKEVMTLLLDRRGDQITITEDAVSTIAGAIDNKMMTLLLDRCGDQIAITDEVVRAAARNWENGKEVMTLLFDRRGDQITITDEVVKAAAGNGGYGTEVMTLLLDRCGDQIAITDEVVKAAAGNGGNGTEVMTLLLDRHGYQIAITDEVVKAAAGNWRNGKEVMTLLLDRCGDQITITDDAISTIAGAFDDKMMTLLLDRCKDQIAITDELVKAAAGSWGNGKEVITLLLDRCGAQISITDDAVSTIAGAFDDKIMILLLDRCRDQIAITDKVVKAAARNWRNTKEVMTLLLDQCTDQITITDKAVSIVAMAFDDKLMTLLLDRHGDQIAITDEVMKAAAGNWGSGKEVITLLLDRCEGQITITDEVVKAAAGNGGNGNEVMTLLLDRCEDQITITDEVVKAAAGNGGNGTEIMTLLLDRFGEQIVITDEVLQIAARNWESGNEVRKLLLDRRGDQVTTEWMDR
jgi:hypothetical protein